MKRLKASGRYLYLDDGEPFFYLGDTAWELIHRLNREEVEWFMKERARQGFTVIQTVALGELDGVELPNAYGRKPLRIDPKTGRYDAKLPDTDGEYSYWDHVDFVIETARKNGLYIALLPTWGDKFCLLWGKGPTLFTAEDDSAYVYGKWIAQRYADRDNIIWMLGGDRPIDEKTRPVIDEMARGILEADRRHLITLHPLGGHNSTEYVNDAEYMSFHTAQTGHDVKKCYDSDGEMLRMAQKTDKPYMDSEPRYEDHPACFNTKLGYYWGQAEVRQNAYWDVLAGSCGHTYGNHNIWCCNTQPTDYFPFHWKEALTHPAAEQIHLVKQLRMRGDFASFRPAAEILTQQYAGEAHLAAACGKGYCYVYSPMGLPISVKLSVIADADTVLKGFWFDPRTGEETLFGIYPAFGENTFVPPSSGKGQDWVLILEKS